jgi:glycosyltransferase involved in cell wall biosynthesis
MINRIKAIIVDENLEEHNYKDVKSFKYTENSEDGFDLVLLKGNENLEKVISDNRDFDAIITIGSQETDAFVFLGNSDFQIRKRWFHFDEFNAEKITNSIIGTFVYNIGSENPENLKLFSFFTCTFNTPKTYIYRLYNSMLNQMYTEWNWYILDDSTNDNVIDIIKGLNDSRITVIKNVSNHGSIGFNKHTVAMMCNGDYLVEVDHDDELTPDCLFWLKKAFETYPDTDFVYSDALEDIDGQSVLYEEGWGWGEGTRRKEKVGTRDIEISVSPEINPYSIRTIYAQPNHVRCWKKNFYHKIGGHDVTLGVLDDMDILIRTFLNGKMTKVNKVLYIQYEGTSNRIDGGETTQGKRFAEIQRTCFLLKEKYDDAIHERILKLGFTDYAWDYEHGYSTLWKEHTPGLEIMSHLLQP